MMINPFGCLLGILLSVLAMGMIFVAVVFNKIKTFLFGLKSQKPENAERTQSARQTKKRQKKDSKKKVFEDNEGEYIEFEEIK